MSRALAAALNAVSDRLAKLPRSPRWIAGGACAAILVVAGIAIAGPESSSPNPTPAAQSTAVRVDPRANRDLARTTPSTSPTTAAPSPSAVTASTPPKPKAAPTTAQVQKAAPKKTTTTTPVVPSAGCSSYKGNQLIACNLLPTFGFSTSQMSSLIPMWSRESGWSTSAANPSGAYGIPQALPGSKMATYGSDWRTNPATQIKWGLSYIKSRYGSPSAAWSYWQSHGWY